jgi:hypothetical protein
LRSNTELLFFRKRREAWDPPTHVHLPIPALNTSYRVQASTTLRYLGFHFDAKLNWSHHVDTVCNRARASLKALQLLGNSVRGLDQASWRLAYIAICLPVLTYGCQLWYKGKQVTLVKKLQMVQNDAVRIITGTFRTTPREPLHQLLTILPMDLRLNMLTQNSALRLYKAPKGSQLLKRLGEKWHTPTADDLPLPSPNRNKVITTLRALATRVPHDGPRILPFPNLPVDAPHWKGRVQLTPKQTLWDYTQVTNLLTESCREGSAVNIYCNAVLSNRDREDGKQLGGATAVLYHEGKELGHSERVFGETVTKADAMTRSLSPGLDTLSLFLTTRPAHIQVSFLLLTYSDATIKRALDASPHEEQAVVIGHLEKIDALLSAFPNITISLQWIPRKIPFVGFRRARQLAFEAIRTATPTRLTEPKTIRKQKESTGETAIAKWAERWYQAPRTSLAYRTALLGPPDGNVHHTFLPRSLSDTQQSQSKPIDHNRNHKDKVKFSRLTHSTLYRFITGHAFTGEYTQRFYPPHTPEQVACQCGEPIQTIEHVLTKCPLYSAERRKHLIVNGRPQTLPQLFAKQERVQALLCFLEETKACAKPRARWEPG